MPKYFQLNIFDIVHQGIKEQDQYEMGEKKVIPINKYMACKGTDYEM